MFKLILRSFKYNLTFNEKLCVAWLVFCLRFVVNGIVFAFSYVSQLFLREANSEKKMTLVGHSYHKSRKTQKHESYRIKIDDLTR